MDFILSVFAAGLVGGRRSLIQKNRKQQERRRAAEGTNPPRRVRLAWF
jgi:hypothetical protein